MGGRKECMADMGENLQFHSKEGKTQWFFLGFTPVTRFCHKVHWTDLTHFLVVKCSC